jgi:hypothetical protein
MIYIRLAGGLGNQLFQLAAGLEIQSKTQLPIVLCTESLNRYSVKREPALLSLIQLPDNIQLYRNQSDVKIKLLKYRLGRLNLPFCINNNTVSKINCRQKFYLVDGYFQDIQWIQNGINQVKGLINNRETDEKVTELIHKFADKTICAIHIRRGDYTSVQNASIYPLLDSCYYHRGIKSIGTNIKTIVVFSDDKSIDFEFFKDYKIVRISDYHLTDYQEFQLMSIFKNIVIANSTFSFWSVVCNAQIDKIKIAHQTWSFIRKENQIWRQNLELESFILI